MGSSPERPPWWDRDVDESGSAIRIDVREAARRIWGRVCADVRSVLGDSTEAQELLEKAVASVSRYLDRNNVPAHDPSGLLIVSVHRSARRLARQRQRVQSVGGTSELAEILKAPDWSEVADRRIFLEQLVRALKERNRAILRLRIAGYEWSEIATMLKVDLSAVRKAFWKDVRRAHLHLLGPGQVDTSTPQKG
jgi:RNA polymerase sigma factor (sigma-70 family)